MPKNIMVFFVHCVALLASLVALIRITQTKNIELDSNKRALQVYPDQPRAAAVIQNDDVTFYCTLSYDVVPGDVTEMPDVTLLDTPNIHNISFSVGDVTVRPFDVTHVNTSTASIIMRNVPLTQNGTMVSCSTRDERDSMRLLVGVEPKETLSFSCENFDWKKMTCTWTERNTFLFTNYTIFYSTQLHSMNFYRCTNETGNTCYWSSSTKILNHFYNVCLEEITATGPTHTCNLFSTIEITKLAIVQNFEVYNLTSRECHIKWKEPNHNMKYKYRYEIFVSPRPSNKSWTTNDTYSEVRGLLPDTYYTIKVRVRHTYNGQITGGAWSDNRTVRFKTDEDVPDANPETHPKGFMLEKIGEEATITAYWKVVPKQKCNGKITYEVKLMAGENGMRKCVNSTNTTASTIAMATKVISRDYVMVIKAVTSRGANVKLNASEIVINADDATPKVRLFTLKNMTFAKLTWDPPSNNMQNSDWRYTVFTCKGTAHKCEKDFNFIDANNATSLDIEYEEGARYGLGISSGPSHKDRMKRDVMTSSDHENVFTFGRAGIQWSECFIDLKDTKKNELMQLSVPKNQAAQTMKLAWTKVPCYAKQITIYLKSASNSTAIILKGSDVTKENYVIKDLVADESYEVYATWSWEYGTGPVRSNDVKYTVTRSGLTRAQLGAVITGLFIAISLMICGLYGMYRKCHKTVKKEVDIAVPEKHQFQRMNDLDLIDSEEYRSLTGNTQDLLHTGGHVAMLETTELPDRRITLDDPISDEHRKQNLYLSGPSGVPAWRQRSQSLESGRPRWQPSSSSRFRSNSVVETQQQMDDVTAAMSRGPLRRGTLGSSNSFEEENGSIYFRMDSASNMGSQGSLNSASGAVARPRAMSVSSVGSAASSFLWMSNSNEDLVSLSPSENNCHYKITSSGPYTSHDGYLKPRSRHPEYKNFSIIREEDEESEYVPSSRDHNGLSFPMDPFDAEVAEANYMAMSNDSYDRTYPVDGMSNPTYNYPKSYRSLTRGRLLSVSSVGSGVILEDYEDENDLYRIASTPSQRQQRSMSFDVAASSSAFLRPRSASVDVLDHRGFHPALLGLSQRLSGDNEYMNPDMENSGNSGYSDNSDNIYLNTGNADVNADDGHYKIMTSSAPLTEIPEVVMSPEAAAEVAEDYLAPVEKHDYSIVEDDVHENDDFLPRNKRQLERQYSVIDENENEALYNGETDYNRGANENEYEVAR